MNRHPFSWIPYVLAGAAGGLITLGLVRITVRSTGPSGDLPVQEVSAKGRETVMQDFVQAAAIAMPAVVHIRVSETDEQARARARQERSNNPWGMLDDDIFFGFPQQRRQIQRLEGTGSGVIISPDGYIVTNNHVVDFGDVVEVTLFDNRKFPARIIGKDPKSDIAVVKIDADRLPTIPFGDSDQAQVGEWVLAVGNPFNLTSTVTAGIISARGRDIDIIQTADAMEAFIQTDAAVNPGNSGGALVNVDGALLGINTAIASRTGYFTGYAFAIPVNMMRRIAEDIIEYGYYQRAKMGLTIVPLDGSLSQELNLPITQGLVVGELEEGGPAELAGLTPFDVIVEANGHPVRSVPDLQEQLGGIKPGEVVQLNVYKEGEYRRVSVRMR